MGKIIETGDRIILHTAMTDREFAKANMLKKEDCSTCWCRYYCGGGCHANAYNFNKTVMEPYHTACEIERKRVENAIMIHIVEGQKEK